MTKSTSKDGHVKTRSFNKKNIPDRKFKKFIPILDSGVKRLSRLSQLKSQTNLKMNKNPTSLLKVRGGTVRSSL